jgi:hypothetical protein
MTNPITLSERDRALLRMLSWTSLTTVLLLRASATFPGEQFGNERRLRERLQAMEGVGFVRSFRSSHTGGGLQNYYKLTVAGFQVLSGTETSLPPKSFFAEISPSLFEHTMQLGEVIVATACACQDERVKIIGFQRENELTFAVGDNQVQPDSFFRFEAGGKKFSVAFEVDLSTESVDSRSTQSIRRKLQTYDAYQELVLSEWFQFGKAWEQPRFRVVFLTRTVERAYHILQLAGALTRQRSRRLVYAATLDAYHGERQRLRSQIFLDHDGQWQALVNLHPSAKTLKTAVNLPQYLEPLLPV